MGETKQINIKNRSDYLYNNLIDLKDFDAKSLKIDKKLHKNIDIYYIGYSTILSLIPFQTSSYFFNNSLFLSTESKIKYSFPFFSSTELHSIYQLAWSIFKYKGFTV